MFAILRLVIFGIVGVFLFAILHKYKKKAALISIVVAVVLVTVAGFVPFENVFLSFKSPEDAYRYYYFGETSVDVVVEGECSDFVIGTKNDVSTCLIVPKATDGWKVGIGLHTKRIVDRFSEGISVHVYQYKDTSDYFITIRDTSGGELTVSDEYNTEFFSLERSNDPLGKTVVTYYAHITDLNPQYSVIVNGNKIVLENQ